MDFLKLQVYLPAVDTLMTSLGDQQKAWLHSNAEKLAPFLKSKNGQEALLLFLSEFHDFVNIKT